MFMLHEGDAHTEGKPRKTEGTREATTEGSCNIQKHGGHGRIRKLYGSYTEGFTEALFKCC